MKVVWQDYARIEFKDAVKYYRVHAGNGIAYDFRDQALRATRKLLEHPELGMRVHDEVRRFPLHDYPYSIIYRLTSEAIIIVAIAHHSRRPGYWGARR